MTPPDLAIVLPTLNESGNLAPLIDRIGAALQGIAWEAIVVDDDSADGTADEARLLARRDGRVRVIQRTGRRGLSSAAIEGMLATAAPHVAVMDADHQHDPSLLPAMLAAVRGGADVAVASRFAPGGSVADWAQPARTRLSTFANRAARRITGVELTDPMSGFFLLETELARKLAPRLSGIGFKILLDMLAASERTLEVQEVPLSFAPRRGGISKLDEGVAFDFIAGLYERSLGRFIPTRFAMFGTVGGIGVLVHLAVLALLLGGVTDRFPVAQASATLATMTFNFWLNNWLTYRDRRLTGAGPWLRGWAGFCLACSVGAFANVAAASLLEARGAPVLAAALIGILLGSVWNYALSSRFVWGRY